MSASGKLVILGILAVALASATASWWFRYAATNQAARFWGPTAARLIRDAPRVIFVDLESGTPVVPREVSSAPGITHLRHALLEDRSFDWPASQKRPEGESGKLLEFRLNSDERSPPLRLLFYSDLNWVLDGTPDGTMRTAVSCRPIARGLAEIFAEFSTAPPAR